MKQFSYIAISLARNQLNVLYYIFMKYDHYNKRGLFCNPNIIANNKERSFQKPTIANHNSSQTLKLLRYHNIRTCTIASPSQLSNLIQLQNFSDYNSFYPLFAINIRKDKGELTSSTHGVYTNRFTHIWKAMELWTFAFNPNPSSCFIWIFVSNHVPPLQSNKWIGRSH
jgi:hypothetical protein